jgi:hypothetical protein
MWNQLKKTFRSSSYDEDVGHTPGLSLISKKIKQKNVLFFFSMLFLFLSFFAFPAHASADTHYFNGAVDGNWGELGNWWMDPAYTIPAIDFPEVGDSVTIDGVVISNSFGAIFVDSLSVINNGSISGVGPINLTYNANFEDNAVLGSSLELHAENGDVTFNSNSTAGASSIYATRVMFNGTSKNTGASFVVSEASNGGITFNGDAYNQGTIAAGSFVVFTQNSYNDTDGEINATTTFSNSSRNLGLVTGVTKFKDSSYNSGAINSVSMAIFLGSTYSTGTITNDACFHSSIINNDINNGSVGGAKTVCAGGIMYFHDPSDNGDWGDLGNWWDDSFFTVPSIMLPTSDTDVHVLDDGISLNSSGQEITVETLSVYGNSVIGIPLSTINGAILNNNSSINDVDIGGNVRLNDSSSVYYGAVSGDVTLNTIAYDQVGSTVPAEGTFTLSTGAIWSTDISGTVYGSEGLPITQYVFNGPTEPDIDINGSAIFNGNPLRNNHNISGDAVFNNGSSNQGTVGGNVTFNDFSFNTGTVSGDATFNTEYYKNASSTPTGGVLEINGDKVWSGSITGTIYGSDNLQVTSFVFSESAVNQGTIVASTITFNDSSYNGTGSITGNVTFSGHSYNQGTISGDILFDTDYYDYTGGTYPRDGVLTISGDRNFEGTYNGDIYVPNTGGMGMSSMVTQYVFRDSAMNSSQLSGNAKFLDLSVNQSAVNGDACFAPTATNNGTVTGASTECPTALYFHDVGNNGLWNDTQNWFTDSAYTIPAGIAPTAEYDVYVLSGEVIQLNGGLQAYAKSLNVTDATVGGFSVILTNPAQFKGSSHNGLLITGDACFAPTATNGGTVSGATSVCGIYFNNSSGLNENDWSQLGNWWLNSAHTIPATELPSSGDDVIITTTISSNSGGAITVRSATVTGSASLGIIITVTQGAIFNGSSSLGGGTVVGTTTFNTNFYDSVNSTVPASGTFTIYNQTWPGSVVGPVIGSDNDPITKYVFRGSASNSNTVYINSEFYDTSFNAGTIQGDACFAPTASNQGLVTGTESVCYVPDTTAPTITLVATSTAPTTATISWTTNESATSSVEYGTTLSYGSTANSTATSTHTVTITELTENTLYHYRINAVDASSNATSTADATFTTTIAPDITPPAISNITTSGITETTTTIAWSTNESATSSVEYGLTSSYGNMSSIGSLNTNHSISLSSLTQSTVYHYRVISTDPSGNTATSTDRTFTTLATTVTPTPTSGGSSGSSGGSSGSSGTSGGVYIIYGNGQTNASSTSSSSPWVIGNNASSTSTAGNGLGDGQGSLPQNNLYIFTINRSLWMTGADVKKIQRYLNTHGFPVANYGVGSLGKETTKFGLATRQAVIRYQKAHKITPTIGYFGPKTRAAFNAGL